MSATDPAVMPQLVRQHHPLTLATALGLLIRAGVDLRTVHLRAVGTYRNYRGEIYAQTPDPGTPLSSQSEIALDVGVSSAVDKLPYQIFYGLIGLTSRSDAWEQHARALFAPFDASQIRAEFARDFLPVVYGFGSLSSGQIDRWLTLFNFAEIDPQADRKALQQWLGWLPQMLHLAGQADGLALILGSLFACQVMVEENVPVDHVVPDRLRTTLGRTSHRLGVDAVLGKTFTECDSGCRILMVVANEEGVRKLLPGQPRRRRLEQLTDALLPAGVTAEIVVEQATSSSQLGSSARVGSGIRLGASTSLTRSGAKPTMSSSSI